MQWNPQNAHVTLSHSNKGERVQLESWPESFGGAKWKLMH